LTLENKADCSSEKASGATMYWIHAFTLAQNHEAPQYRPKIVFRHFCIQNFRDGIQIQVCNIINEIVYHSSQFISVNVKKNLRKISGSISGNVKKIEAQAK